ncbi:hypothetical protein PAHAL_1G053100 [Panicum hallii]|uniref:Uncharacterized protein n=1 Tax=Panicum hallii TaxID=206008 RepID=A0A2T8KU40_9POAL|nr:hypothetical protein PAHAL_1G053100 [Panicum hallii]
MDLTAPTATGKQATHHDFFPFFFFFFFFFSGGRRVLVRALIICSGIWHMLATRVRARASLTAKIRWG